MALSEWEERVDKSSFLPRVNPAGSQCVLHAFPTVTCQIVFTDKGLSNVVQEGNGWQNFIKGNPSFKAKKTPV